MVRPLYEDAAARFAMGVRDVHGGTSCLYDSIYRKSS
jgi:hypothetical protein